MRRIFEIVLLAILCASSAIYAQQGNQPKKAQYVAAPSESILVTVASQPNCPVQIEAARLLVPVDRKNPPIYQYKLRNTGQKTVRFVSVWALTSNALGGGPLHTDGLPLKKALLPGHYLAQPEIDVGLEILPLTDEWQRKLKLGGAMRVVAVLIIERVEFSDGSSFVDHRGTEALIEYFSFINSHEINSRADP